MVNDDERDSTIFLGFLANQGRWEPGKVGKLENHP